MANVLAAIKVNESQNRGIGNHLVDRPGLASDEEQCHIESDMDSGLKASGNRNPQSNVKAVLGPTNTGKTHLAIERLCGHSSGVMGFPLRLLAREVYDRVCVIKGERNVALITGEERIEPPDARWKLCTAEAMPVETDAAFVALDEAQLAADRERGHVFTDRLLHARGRDETMLLGSATLEPLVHQLLPGTEIVGRPRFSTLSHAGTCKLSRLPPRSAVVAFSAEQVYAIAEMLRRFRGGAAVVMGALSPSTRNAQVALYQSGEVDYIVATDAIGMGLNLDVDHVAFAALTKFDGVRQRRLTPAEMAQIAGRAGRHQRDGTFGTLAAGQGARTPELTEEEIHAIEEHRFAPLQRLFWREPEPHFTSLETLIADLEAPPQEEGLVKAPEAIDLAVLKRLADESDVAVSGEAQVARFWDVCRLPDFRQLGIVAHSQFVARLWRDLREGQLAGDYVAQSIANLDNLQGDIDTLQGRIAAIRTWSYIAQRSDWVLARGEMAERARAVEARLSDALHARLAERFINRRTSVLMKKMGGDAGLLRVQLEGDDVLVEGHLIGTLEGFVFRVDPQARHAERKLFLAAAEKHVPRLLATRSEALITAIARGEAALDIRKSEIECGRQALATLVSGETLLQPRLEAGAALRQVPEQARTKLLDAQTDWLKARLSPLRPLHRLQDASRSEEAGPELRALLIALLEAGGLLEREGSGIEKLDKAQRASLARLGVQVGALDLYVPKMLRPIAIETFGIVARASRLTPPDRRTVEPMRPVLPVEGKRRIAGYRRIGAQHVRIDIADKLLREAHRTRAIKPRAGFRLEQGKAVSMGLTSQTFAALLKLGGFRQVQPRRLPKGAAGPPAPLLWRWRPARARPPHHSGQHKGKARPQKPVAKPTGAFAELAGLFG